MLTFQGTTTYNVNNLNQYTNVTYPRNGSQTETVNFVYDDNGNLLQDDKREYQYDYRNRLIKATNLQNHEIITFKYDILNRRIQKTDRSKSWKWVYSFQDVAEEDWYMNASMTAGAIKVREFVYGNGMDDLVYMEQNKPLTYQDEQEEEGYTEVYTGGGFNTAVKRYFFQKDLAGSTKIVSDIQGKVIEMYAYDSFGRIYERNGISGNYRPFQTSRVNHNRFFTNREYDTDLQLYYYRARWYSPALGRFMSRDPLGYAAGVNLYRYVNNNPSTYTDPWGLIIKPILPSWQQPKYQSATISAYSKNSLTNDVQRLVGQNEIKFQDMIVSENLGQSSIMGGILTWAKEKNRNDSKIRELCAQGAQHSYCDYLAESDEATDLVMGAVGGGKVNLKGLLNLTNKQVKDMAKELGLKEAKEFGVSQGEKIYRNGNKYYSYDNTAHNGGVWKVFEKIGSKLKRIGTADADLNVFKE